MHLFTFWRRPDRWSAVFSLLRSLLPTSGGEYNEAANAIHSGPKARTARPWGRPAAALLAAIVSAGMLPGFAILDSSLPSGSFQMELQLQTGGTSAANWNSVAQDCLAEWNTHLTGTKFTWVSNSSVAHGMANGKNNVFWSKDIYGETFGSNVLAVTLIWNQKTDASTVRETDTLFNRDVTEGWASYRGPLRPNGAYDFRRVALHEFGHTIGLDHPDEHGWSVAAVMNSTISDTDDLTGDDLAGATYLLGPKSAPKITSQPADVITDRNSQYSLNFTATGRGPLTYYWEKDGVRLSGPLAYGVNSPNYTHACSQQFGGNPAKFTVVVANAYGSVRSRVASLSFSRGLTSVPVDQTVSQGGTAKFAVTIPQGAKATYYWLKGDEWEGKKIAGATSATLTLRNVQPADAGLYTVVANISGQGVYTAAATLRLPLGVAVSASATVLNAGDTVTLTGSAVGNPTIQQVDELAVDRHGNVYFADQGIRKVTPAGTISTLYPFEPATTLPTHYGWLACDASDNLYLSNGVISKRTARGTISIIAGNTDREPSNNPGRALWSGLGTSTAIACASDGTIYIASLEDHLIRKLDTHGMLSVFAKSGFREILSLVAAPDGSLYAVDVPGSEDDGRGKLILKVSPTGKVTTIAGGPQSNIYAGSVDGSGTKARFAAPWGLGRDAAGNLYVADGCAVRKITPKYAVTTFAGSLKEGGYVDGSGTSARFNDLRGLAVDPSGNIYVADTNNHLIRKITPAGGVTTLAGIAGTADRFDGSRIKSYQWKRNGSVIPGATRPTLTISHVAAKDLGSYTLTVANATTSTTSAAVALDIRPTFVSVPAQKIQITGSTVTLSAQISNPAGRPLVYQWKRDGVAIKGANQSTLQFDDLETSDEGIYTLVVTDGKYTVTTPAIPVTQAVQFTAPPPGGDYADGSTVPLVAAFACRTEPVFASPQGIASDSAGNLYVVDYENRDIRKISPAGETTTLAGDYTADFSYTPTDGKGSAGHFSHPSDLARDAAGNLYVADFFRLRKVSPTGVVSTLAGEDVVLPNGKRSTLGSYILSNVTVDAAGIVYVSESCPGGRISKVSPDGSATLMASGFISGSSDIQGLAVTPSGTVYAGGADHAIYIITPSGKVSLLAGAPGQAGEIDGPATQARLGSIDRMALDSAGTLYVVEFDGHVRTVSPEGVVATLVTDTTTEAWFGGIHVTDSGRIFLTDSSHHVIYTITQDGHYEIWNGQAGESGHRDGAPASYQWRRNGAAIAGATGKTYIIDDLQAGDAGDYTLDVITTAGTSRSGVATIARHVAAGWDLTVDPHTRLLTVGAATSFAVTARGTEPLSYQWLKDGVPIPGATDPTWTLSAATAADNGYYAASVTNAAGSSTSAAAAVQVGWSATAAPAIVASSNSYGAGHSLILTAPASIGLDGTIRYQWMKDGAVIPNATSATLTFDHLLAADSAAYTVRLTGDNRTITSEAFVLPVPTPAKPTIVVQPADVSIVPGAAASFAVTVAEEPSSKSFQWYHDGQAIAAATSAIYSLSSVTAADAGSYSVTVRSDGGQVSSRNARLSLRPAPPQITRVSNVDNLVSDTWSPLIHFTVSDPDTPASALQLSVSSDDRTLIPSANFEIGGSGSDRTLRYKSGLHRWGSTAVRVGVSDGTSTSGVMFYVTITHPDIAPSIDPLPNVMIARGTKLSLPFTITDYFESIYSRGYQVTSSNAAILPSSAFAVSKGTAAGALLEASTVKAALGSTVVTITGQNPFHSFTRSFRLTIVASNKAPTISAVANQTLTEDHASAVLKFTVADPDTSAASLRVVATSSNATLFPAGSLVLGGSGTNRTVKLVPAANQNGTAIITLKVSDGSLSASRTFSVAVAAVDDAPTITSIGNQTVPEDWLPVPLKFTVADVDSPVGNLTISAKSTNSSLVPAANLVLGGSGANRTIAVKPVADQSGSTTITLIVSDGQLSTSRSFTFTVTATDDPPSISAIADQSLTEDLSSSPIAFTVGDIDSPVDRISLSATSSDPALFPASTISFGGSGAGRTITLKPAANRFGSATVTILATSGSLSTTRTFRVAVAPVDDAPAIGAISSQTTTTGALTPPIVFNLNDPDTDASQLTVTADSSNSTLIPVSGMTIGGSGSVRFVRITPAAGLTGTSLITLTVSDGHSASSTRFTLTVIPGPQVAIVGDRRQVVAPGNPFAFAVSVAGGGVPVYRWFQHGREIAGETGPVFSRLAATTGDAGWYSVDVTDSGVTRHIGPFFLLVAPPQLSLSAWGDNTFRSLNVPDGLTRPIAVATGWTHVLALEADGSLRSWGSRYAGNLDVPADLVSVASIAAGSWFSVALAEDGTATLWGSLDQAGTFPYTAFDLVSVAAGENHVLGLKLDGTVLGWGQNTTGQISIPYGLAHVTAIAAGAKHSLALLDDGAVVAWGDNTFGQILVPSDLANVTAIAAGSDFSLALKSDGTVVAWGDDSLGQTEVPAGLTGVSAISAGEDHALALKSDGSIVAWGGDWGGQTDIPAGTTNVFTLSAGAGVSFALRDVTPAAVPAFTTAPTDASVAVGHEASFSVIATGYPAPTYRWQISTDAGATWADLGDNATYTGVAASVLTIAEATAELNGARFRCLVSNAVQTDVASTAATLTVNP